MEPYTRLFEQEFTLADLQRMSTNELLRMSQRLSDKPFLSPDDMALKKLVMMAMTGTDVIYTKKLKPTRSQRVTPFNRKRA